MSLFGIFMSSYAKNLIVFVLLYGGLSGMGSGITYLLPMVCGWEYFPEKKGLVTGIIIGSFGAGSFFFIQIAKYIVNPYDEPTSIHINDILSYFDEDISLRVPIMLRQLCLIWSV